MIDLAAAHAFAVQVAKDAGIIARKHYDPNIVFDPKADNTPITKADIAINQLVIKRCDTQYPDIGVLGEEESTERESEWLWVCDPIDGTIPYMLGAQVSTFCLALVHDGVPVVGVVYDFMNDRLYSAIKGQGAWLNGNRIQPVTSRPLKLVELEMWPKAQPVGNLRELLFGDGWQATNFASYAFTVMAVATGRISGTIYTGTYAWDVAAAKVIAEECGCQVVDLDGKEQRYDTTINGGAVFAPIYADALLSLLRKARQ